MNSNNIMANVYYKLVKNGIKKIEEVPENLRAAVQTLLDMDNATQPNK